MRPAPATICACALLSLALGPATASAQEATTETPRSEAEAKELGTDIVTEEPEVPGRDALDYNARILDEVLTQSTTATIREQKFAAAAGILGGMTMLGLATWRLAEDPPANQYSRGLGVMFVAIGTANLTTGVYAATRIPHERRRLERWEKARKDGITQIELAHFEGELQASRETRQGERLLVRWNGLAQGIGGLLVIAFVPIPDETSGADRTTGYIAGAVVSFVGFATFAASFRDTPSEKAWNQYLSRRIPMPGHELSFRVSPAISRRGAGLTLGGRF